MQRLRVWFLAVVATLAGCDGLNASTSGLAQRVLILVNDNMPPETGTNGVSASISVGQYYASKRGIPYSNIVHVNTTTSESIVYSDYQNQTQNPVRAVLDANNGQMRNTILYIVPVYGVPSRTVYNGQTLTLDSVLSSMYSSPDTYFAIYNPYSNSPGSRPPTSMPGPISR